MGSATGKNKAPKPANTTAKQGDDDAKLEWLDVDENDAKVMGGSTYGDMKKARELAREKTTAFEAACVAHARKRGAIGDDKTFRFGYRWGKISVAIVDDDGRDRSTPKAKKFKLT